MVLLKGQVNGFQSVYQIGNVRIGGNDSQIPSVLIGSIFYMRHKIVKNDQTGEFDELEAAKLIHNCVNLSGKLGIGFMLDVVGTTHKALINYVKFIKKITDAPVLINSTLPETRIAAVKELAEVGMLDNIVYNSINTFSTEEEIKVLAKLPVEAAVVQAYNPKSKKPDGPLKALLGNDKMEGLLAVVSKCGIDKIMVDIPTLDMSSVGLIGHSVKIIKEKLDVPVGTAPSNATYTSAWLKDRSNVSIEQFRAVDATVNAYLVAKGCNFLFFGPIEGANWVFPACAMVDAVNVYGSRYLGVSPDTESHPMFVVL
ncbi:N5-methyltetrahydromethanopterin:coenzyme M methyltransferase subunit H [Desulfocucumis palustris]|uniref:N5-methyltetrahydromethanopterin:coenzyme M methyltransferase subunit H n=1 Tax=Desulfocucumis palustris TaxID=1898651 RepID=A0A2L2XD58_9FIRM|nr:hypothetical protein [Desulfocucumis palustris]GBF33663.1 N5-methyltetrahydromethanopterin:coenzyme M methyltransferase subunit H [Desulfocucumis palustris]